MGVYSDLRAAMLDLFNNYTEFSELVGNARELKKIYPHFAYVDCIECAIDNFKREKDASYKSDMEEHGNWTIGGINF